MTDRKHFKQLVRERMRRTGERYTVARRHVAGGASLGWELRGGLDGETAAFANVLANLGVEAGGAPLSEAMVLGAGGGLGAGYILWEFESHGYAVLTLGFRRQWQYPDRWAASWPRGSACTRRSHETGGAKGAAAALDAQLDRGLPAIAWVDPYQLGLRGLPASRDGFGGAPVVVYERAGDTYAIDDRSRVARDGLRRRARRRARPRRLLQAPADHDRPRARRPLRGAVARRACARACGCRSSTSPRPRRRSRCRRGASGRA